MANVFFKKGLLANLPSSYAAGTFYVTTDERAMYLDIDDSTRMRLGDFIQVDAVANLPTAGASTSALYYCVSENVLAKWNGSAWTQINKQPTADEMKALLGLGAMAYKSEVTEGDLNADLKAKVNAAAEGNHSHDNKALLDTYTQTEADLADAVAKKHSHSFADEAALNGITAAKVADWDDAVSKEHAHTFADADVEDAISKKHSHTFVESELNKIVAGDVAKWNGVVADHLTSADKTAIEDSIGDVNTALENYKTSNNEALAGVKATADAAATKEYTDAEFAKKVAKTDYEADKATFATKTDIAKLAGVSEGANKVEASATNGNIKIDGVETVVYTHPDKHAIGDVTDLQDALDAKVAKADYESDKATFATKTELGNVDKKFENYVTSASYATDKSATETALADRYTKEETDGKFALIADAYDDAEVRGLISDNADAIAEIAGDYVKAADIADFETKDNVQKVADDLAAYVESNDAAVADRYTKSEADGKFALIADAYDDEEVRGLISDNADAIAAETERATGIEAGLRTDVDAIKGDYLKNADKTALQEQITANANAITALTDGIDPDKIDGLTDLVNWANEHAPEVESIKNDIEANAKAIADQATSDAATYETKADATSKKTEIDGRLDAIEGKVDVEKVSTAIADAVKVETDRATGIENGLAGRIKDLEDNKAGYATTGEVATAKQEAVIAAANDAASKYEEIGVAQTKVDALANGQVKANTEAIATKANASDVYAKTETYTQAEVDALIQQATQWGEF